MRTAEFSIYIDAPIERVWAFWTDYERYSILKGVSRAELLKEGSEEKNGVGAVRRIRVLGVTFTEEIVAFDPPHRFDYKVRECTIPMEHEMGTMEFTESNTGTFVRMSTTSKLKLPKIAFIFLPAFGIMFNRAFQSALNQSKAILESA